MTQRRSWRWRIGWVAVAAVLGSAVLGTEAALAASGWLPPADISAQGAAASRVQIAVDAQGNVVAVWRGGVDGGEVRVQGAVRPAGGPWQAPVDISKPGLDGSSPPGRTVPGPQLALDAHGNAVAVWQRFNGTSLVVQAAERPAGGRWRAPADVSVPGAAGEDSGSPDVAIDARGNAIVVWHRFDPVRRLNRVQSASRPAGGTWQPPVAVSSVDVDATGARIAVDAQGGAIALWDRPAAGGGDPTAQSAVRQPDGTWQAPQDIPGSSFRVNADLAVDPAGNAVVVWERIVFEPGVLAAVRPAGGSWQGPVRLASTGLVPRVDYDAAGNATAIWGSANAGVMVASRTAGGDWQPAATLDATGGTVVANVAVDAGGDAIATWSNANHPGAMARRRIAGAWQETTRLSADGRSPSTPELAVDPSGNAVAAWSDATAGVVSAAGLDATPPELRAVAVPAAVGAGRRVAFSVSPFDVWSATTPAAWTFGDGATATGNAVRHTYTEVGPRTVAVTTTDALGNATTATRAIVVAPSVLGLQVAPYAFRASRPGRVSMGLVVASRVRFVVERVRIGRRVTGRCVAPTAGNRRHAICNRYVRAGSFTRSRPKGRHRLKLPTRLAGRRLTPGRYRLSATPRASGLTGKPSRSGFRVTR
jgi:hypothetical protein